MTTNTDKDLRCIRMRNRHVQRLHTFIAGISEAPTDKCSEFCEHAAFRELRHIIKYAEILKYYLENS